MSESHNLTEKQRAAYKEAFDMFDKNDDGHISTNELIAVMQVVGHNPSREEARDALRQWDKNDNGMIEFDEFVSMLLKLKSRHTDQNAELRKAFEIFDKNGNGLISADELKIVLTQLGEKLTDEEVADMLKCADTDADGFVNLEEFCVMMKTQLQDDDD